ncbi:hypothetical protein ABEI56_05485 [Peribacillus castrilensis]|uniref:hypothetical protein n=1 Tax=Peribacillus castrilensis TaxID=2897690 RepID=UPI003D275C76
MKKLLVSTAMAATLLVGAGAGYVTAKDPGVVTSSITPETVNTHDTGITIQKKDPGVVSS